MQLTASRALVFRRKALNTQLHVHHLVAQQAEQAFGAVAAADKRLLLVEEHRAGPCSAVQPVAEPYKQANGPL